LKSWKGSNACGVQGSDACGVQELKIKIHRKHKPEGFYIGVIVVG
jgi:hypothetical protein